MNEERIKLANLREEWLQSKPDGYTMRAFVREIIRREGLPDKAVYGSFTFNVYDYIRDLSITIS